MPQSTPYLGLVTYNIFGDADGLLKIGQALDDDMGTKSNSNMRKIDNNAQSQNTLIVQLQNQINNLILNNFVIYNVDLNLEFSTSTSSTYSGTTTDFTNYE